MARPILACLLAAAFLAGCTMPSDTTTSTTGASATAKPVDASTYKITLDWVNPGVQAGLNFTFTEHIDGTIVTQSTHIGAHFGNATHDLAQASTTTYTKACVHAGTPSTPKSLPGDFEITCTAPAQPGTYYLRGHARENVNGSDVNWWSDEVHFDVHA